MSKYWKWINSLLLVVLSTSCMNTYIPLPKQKAYFRITYPEKVYAPYQNLDCPYTFEIPTYAKVNHDVRFFDDQPSDPCWANIEFAGLNAKLHLSYKPLDDHYNVQEILDDTRELTWKHTVKAQFIDENPIEKPNDVHGIYYSVGGNAASAIQFYLTDSTDHFLRASLYFHCKPNRDSLQEVIDFVEADVLKFIETFEWKH